MRKLARHLGRGLLLCGFPLMFTISLPAGVAALAAGAVLVWHSNKVMASSPAS